MSGNSPQRPAPSQSERFADKLREIAQARTREQRDRALEELALMLHQARSVVFFLARLVQGDRNAQRLALEIAARLPAPLDPAVPGLLQNFLGNPRFSSNLRAAVAVQSLRSRAATIEECAPIFQALTQGLAPGRAMERLQSLQSLLPGHAGLKSYLKALERQSSIACPRCAVRLSRPDLIVHLWQEHRLMLDGSRAREPWKLIEEWLADYAESGRPELLERSCELGEQLDPQNGLTRVHRLLLAAGLTDDEAQQNLVSQAAGRKASLCPHCYALVPERNETTIHAIEISSGRVRGKGYELELTESSVFTRLYVDCPDGVLHAGTEPGRALSRRGQVIFFIGPFVVAALLLAILLPTKLFPPLTPVALLLLIGFLIYLRLRMGRDPRVEITRRLIDHAWDFLAPILHRPDFSRSDAEFLASLARTSMGIGSAEKRESLLEKMGKLTQSNIQTHKIAPEYLTALKCLEIDDAIRSGKDPLMILANQVSHCLAGELPLVYGEQLLDAWPVEARDRAQRARLRVLLCAKAFELGFEARDVQEVGQVCPSIGQAIGSDDLHGLVRLRWLWEIKPSRNWQRYGTATTAFDLARYPALGGQFLETRPDLLLFQPTSDIGSDADPNTPILICQEGVVYRDIVIRDLETPITVRERSESEGDGYELAIGRHKLAFYDDPTMTSKRLQGWVRFLFKEFLPNSAGLRTRRNPAKLKQLLRQKTMRCPECEHPFLALRGEVGIVTDTEVKEAT